MVYRAVATIVVSRRDKNSPEQRLEEVNDVCQIQNLG